MIPITPIGNKVVIKRNSIEEMTKGGLYIPGKAQVKEIEGVVISVGPGLVHGGKFHPTRVKPGQTVIFPVMNATEFMHDGVEYVIVSEIELFGAYQSF